MRLHRLLIVFFLLFPFVTYSNEVLKCPNGKTVNLGDSIQTVISRCQRDKVDHKGYLVARPSIIRWNKVTEEVTYDNQNKPIHSQKILEKHALLMLHSQDTKKSVTFQFLDDRLIGTENK
ncbi:hypothetical protein L3V86_03315 [Thiotrichales bacterium 19S11-10]|nr:hypothetical protein [Thiotrichales bacterium 19S11-10]